MMASDDDVTHTTDDLERTGAKDWPDSVRDGGAAAGDDRHPGALLLEGDPEARSLVPIAISAGDVRVVRPHVPESIVWKRKEILLLVAITLVAGALRLFRLGEWSLWIDEAHTLRDATASWSDFWQSPIASYPVAYLTLREVLVVLPGMDEASLRLVFTFFGIISVPLLGVAVRHMLGSGPAMFAAALLALSPWHIYWSQNCRFYSLVLCLGLAASTLFFLGIERASLPNCLLSLLFSALAALCHPSGALILPAFGLYLLALRFMPTRPRGFQRRILVPVLSVMAVAGLWALIRFLPNISSWFEKKSGESMLHLVLTTGYYVRIPVLVAAVGGAVWLLRSASRAGLFLTLLVAVPMAELAFVAVWAKATAQYLFYTLPAFAALAGLGTHVITHRIISVGISGWVLRHLPVAIILLDMLSSDYLYFFHTHGDRPRWSEAVELVKGRLRPHDLVLSTNGPSMSYYLGDREPVDCPPRLQNQHVITPWNLDGRDETAGGPLLRELVKEQDAGRIRGSVWIVITQPEFEEMDTTRTELQYLRDKWSEVAAFRCWTSQKDMIVHVFRRDPRR